MKSLAGLGVVLLTVAAACGSSGGSDSNTSGSAGGPDGSTTDGGGPGGGDGGGGDAAPPPPCELPAFTLKVATLAGCSDSGSADGARGIARFSNPTNTLIGADGVVYVADFDNSLVRSVDATGTTRTVYRSKDFVRPFGLALAPGGKLYVQTDGNDKGARDTNTGTLWLVDPTSGSGAVIARDLGRPRGLAVLGDGRIVMSDYAHHVIRILDPNAPATSTVLAGTVDASGYLNATGAAARFAKPYDIVVLGDGDLAVADQDNHRIRRVTLAGVVTDIAGSGAIGSDNGAALAATFDAPQGLGVSGTAIYVSDIKALKVRKIDGGQVTTVAGAGGGPAWFDSDDPMAARFSGLEGLDVDATRVVVAAGNSGESTAFNHVRLIRLP